MITLLPKKGELNNIQNWRPISVLTTDYKILAKALSIRLSEVMNSIVGTEQAYSVPERTIYDNLHIHRDVIRYANHENLPLAILNLDQRAAFDEVNHHYLFHVLSRFGIGEKFVGAIKTLYRNASFHICVTSLMTGQVFFQKGIRQGCPLSGPLYTLSIEPFLNLC